MSIQGERLTRNQFKRLFGGVALCLSMSLIACQQTKESSSVDNNSKENLKGVTIQAANRKNSDRATIPLKTPAVIPTPNATPQAIPSNPNSVETAPDPASPPATQSAPDRNDSLTQALTEKLSRQAASQQNIPKPQTQVETQKPTSPKPVVEALRTEAKNPARKVAAASNTNVYRSQRLGVNFRYPKGFVIKEPQSVSGSSQKVLELWSLKDYQEIARGKFQNTASPGNMSISLENNPQGLSLVEWVTNNEELGDIIPESYDTAVVAGKEAMSFRTEGLYDFQNLVLPSNDGKNIILISFAQGDQSYQQVFNQVVSSLQVN